MDRSLSLIDEELSSVVKARASARAQISMLSGSVVSFTRRIDQLLAERSIHVAQCPDTPAALVEVPKGA